MALSQCPHTTKALGAESPANDYNTYTRTQNCYWFSRPMTITVILSSVSAGENNCSIGRQLKLRLEVYSRPLGFQCPVKSNQLSCLSG